MPRIYAVDSYMNDCTNLMALVPYRADSIHHLCVTHTYYLSVHSCTDALAGNLFHLFDGAAVRFVRISVFQRDGYGVSGETFYVSSQMQQLSLADGIGMNGGDVENAFCHRARLVEGDSRCMR
jgi:hypothetical protein